MPNAGTKGRYIFRHWRPMVDDRIGICFKETLWGNNQVRWVWLRFDDGSEKAYAPSHLRSVDNGS